MAKVRTQEAYARGLVVRPHRANGGRADWATVNSQSIRICIASAGASGGAVRFGYTRDGGAYAVGIYGLGEPYTEYVRPGEDIEGFLKELGDAYTKLRQEGATEGPAA